MTAQYQAALSGFPGDLRAANMAGQVSQFLVSHGAVPVYEGNAIWTAASQDSLFNQYFSWPSSGPGWLPSYDVDQPFTMPAGNTAIGRVKAAVQPYGNGADLQVLLCADNGSGSPVTSSPLASAVIPAACITSTAPSGTLAQSGPLVTARDAAALMGAPSAFPWAQPAVDAGGAGNYAVPVTSGTFTVFVGGVNASSAQIGTVSAVQYQGGGLIGGAVPQPPLPQAASGTYAAATPDTIVVAGGAVSASANTAGVWTAPWSPSSGVVGAWSAQQALPSARQLGACAAWGETVYVIGGYTGSGTLPDVWMAQVSNGQISSWTACPPLPAAVMLPYAAVIGDWLIVAGGQAAQGGSGTTACWYSAIGSDGTLAGWQQGPPLPQEAYSFQPGWNLAVTDSAMVIISGSQTPAATSVITQALTAGPDGPAGQWQVQSWAGSVGGEFQVAAFPSGLGGWQAVNYHLTDYDSAAVTLAPVISVPLPVSGLTAGTTYHLVFRQLGGDTVSSYLSLGTVAALSGQMAQYAARYGTSWTALTERAAAVACSPAAGPGLPLHLYQDAGASVTTLITAPSGGQLLGAAEMTTKPPVPLNVNPAFAATTSPWTASGGTLALSGAETHGGYPSSGLLTAAGTGQAYALTEQEPCTELDWYVITGWFYAPAGYAAFAANLLWFSADAYLGTSSSPLVTLPAATWTEARLTAQAPAGATTFAGAPTLTGSPSSGTLLYLSDVTLTAADPGRISAVSQIEYAGNGMPAGVLQLA